MTVFVVTKANGDYVKTVLSMAGERLYAGWAAHEVDAAAGPGQVWSPETLGWIDDADEQERHARATQPVITDPLAEIETLKARLAALEAAQPS